MFHYDMRTKWVTTAKTIEWTVDKVADFKFELLKGPVFEINGDLWHLDLKDGRDTSKLCLRLGRTNSKWDAHAKYVISVRGFASEISNKVLYMSEEPCNSSEDGVTCKNLATWDRHLFLSSVTIFLRLEFRRLKTAVYERCLDADVHHQVVNSLSEGALTMYHDGSLSDINLNVNGVVLKTHKFILNARCPVLRERLKKYQAATDLKIEDVDVQVVKVMLDYMYSKVNFNLDFDHCLSVYEAACKYQMDDMSDLYGKLLFRDLLPVNAGRLLKAAEKYQNSALKAAVLDFIVAKQDNYPNFNFDQDIEGRDSNLCAMKFSDI